MIEGGGDGRGLACGYLQNEKFSKTEKFMEFATCDQNKKFSKTEKIQKFVKYLFPMRY